MKTGESETGGIIAPSIQSIDFVRVTHCVFYDYEYDYLIMRVATCRPLGELVL